MSTELAEVAAAVQAGGKPTETVRTLLRRFGFERRGYHKVRDVRRALASAKLTTLPDFNAVPLDAEITYHPASRGGSSSSAAVPAETQVASADSVSGNIEDVSADATYKSSDPTYRLNRLDDGSQELVSVKPDETLRRATTLMMSNDYSQLAVISGGRTLKGVVSWKSLGMRFALGGRPEFVREAMEEHTTTVESDASLFAAIPRIIENDYALVRRADGSYWIVTTADLSSKFRELAEPFLLLAEIENQLRGLLDEHLSKPTLQAAKDPSEVERRIQSAADLTLGEVLRLLEQQEQWDKLAPALDRVEVIGQLVAVKNIRNDVMHFDPEGVGPSDLQTLRTFARFLQDFRRYEPVRTNPMVGTA